MKILLDECVPKQLKAHLADHEVWTVPEAGWAGLKNGVLIQRAAGKFPVMITVDRDLPHQQNIRGLEVMIVVLATEDNRVESLVALIPMLQEALRRPRWGEFVVLKG